MHWLFYVHSFRAGDLVAFEKLGHIAIALEEAAGDDADKSDSESIDQTIYFRLPTGTNVLPPQGKVQRLPSASMKRVVDFLPLCTASARPGLQDG